MSGLPLSELCKRFDSKGSYINRGRVVATDTMTTREAYLHLNVGYYRLLELKEFYGVTNHKVVSVETCGKSFVYDIEVEDFNNFIASEICVHNSSSKPNLQNQPNSDLFPVRKAFIAAEGYKLVVLDWSQIELRVTAHFSKDERLMQAFLDGRDIHQEVADAIHIKRKEAKSVNFGILYGLSAASLALYIKNTEKVATKMLSDYGDTYNGVMAWKRHVEQQCADNGYVKNMFGRVRRLPHVKERKFYFRALRQAVNFVIQGTCADMMKLAMIRVHEFFKAENIDARILLTVHDELVIECRANITQYVFTRVKEIMEQLIPMRVPIIADGKICDNWSQMKDDKYEGYMSSQKYLNLLTTTF